MVLRGQDAWRKHPIFKWGFTDLLPGFREATVLFGAYVGAEYAYEKYQAKAAKASAGAAAAVAVRDAHAH